MTLPGMPGEGWPVSDYAHPVNTGSSTPHTTDWTSRDEDDWKQTEVRNPFLSSFNPIGAFRGFLISALQGLTAGPLQFISDLMSLRWAQMDDLQSRIEDIPILGDFFELITGIPDSDPNDAASWIKGRITGAETLIRDARNAIWSGVTRQEPEEDKSAAQVEAALSALRSRAQETALENELMSLGSVPVHEGPSSAGDVTCHAGSIDWYQPLDVAGQTSNTVVAFTDHYHGDGTLNIPAPTPPQIAGTVAASWDLISTFRAKSTLPKEIVTFAASGISSEMDGAWVYLLTYDFALDKWVIVATGDSSCHTLLGTDWAWIDSALSPVYTPAIGELMAVGWRTKPKTASTPGVLKLAASRRSSAPSYHSVPYGLTTAYPKVPVAPAVGETFALPRLLGGDPLWSWGQVPYAQIGPDLGQASAEPEKLDFYDDFNRGDLGSSYARFSSSGVVAGLSNNRLAFRETNNGMQAILRRQQLNTNKTRVEATLFGAGSTASADLIINSNSSLTNFLTVGITSANVYVYTGTAVGDGTQRKVTASSNNNVRWAVEYDPVTKVYSIFKGGAFFDSWPDPTGIVRTGPGERFNGAATARQTFFNSGQWDDLLMFDV